MQISKVNRENGIGYYNNAEGIEKAYYYFRIIIIFLFILLFSLPAIFSNLGPGRDERNHSFPNASRFINIVGLWRRDEKECADESTSERFGTCGKNKLIRSISSISGTERVLYVRCFMRSKPARYVYLYK